jgi:hypothetical protein
MWNFWSFAKREVRKRFARQYSAERMPTREKEKMVKAGADINARDKEGNTALMIATQERYFWAVKVLLEAGAKPDTKDSGRKSVD